MWSQKEIVLRPRERGQGRLNLGTWQGIYLLEFREYKSARLIIATITGE